MCASSQRAGETAGSSEWSRAGSAVDRAVTARRWLLFPLAVGCVCVSVCVCDAVGGWVALTQHCSLWLEEVAALYAPPCPPQAAQLSHERRDRGELVLVLVNFRSEHTRRVSTGR
ncbi:hypothetical protein MHYP_G00293880 [Metynnis hypsauchen]